MNTAPKNIPITPRLANRPRWHGLPIPYIALIKPDGLPDFRVTDEAKRRETIFARLCQLCGAPLGRNLFFTGGPECARHLQYFEPAAHLDCLIYAMQVCPFIAGGMDHAPVADVQRDNPTVTVRADSTFTTVKSETWVIVKATGFTVINTGETLLVKPSPVVFQSPRLMPPNMIAADWNFIRRQLFNAI